MKSGTRRFADHLLALAAGPLDEAASCVAGDLLVDGLAVAALGAGEPGPRILAGIASQDGGQEASIVAGPGRACAAGAARANGAAMHVLDYEPMWNPANHSVSTTLPALLALSERLAVGADASAPDGATILRAFAIGIEAQARLRQASGRFEPADLVFHPPGQVGPIGSAVACGLLLGLDGGQMAHAITIAASRTGGLLVNVGSMTKALHCGQAAASGLESALMASLGFTGDADALFGPRGYGMTLDRQELSAEILLMEHPSLHIADPGPAFKFYPSQYGTHFVITAALEARRAMASGAAIETVRIVCPRMPYVDRPDPPTGLAGKFSFQYTAAAALLDGRVGVASFTDARRFSPDMVGLLPRIVVEPDLSREGRFDRMRVDVEIWQTSGATARGSCDGPPGIWGRPVEADLLREKALDCLCAVFGESEGRALHRLVSGFSRLDAQAVVALMRRMNSAPAGEGPPC